MNSGLTLSIVIPAYNEFAVLGRQLNRLVAQVGELGLAADQIEIVIADNGSTDGTAQVAKRFADSLPMRLIDASGRRGPAAARNIGASRARGRVLVFTDADDLVSEGWLRAWWAWAYAAGPFAFGAGPLAVGDGPRADKRVRIPHQMGLPYASGNNLGCTARLFANLGGFDESRWTGEDIDLSWRAIAMGIPVESVPAFVYVAHHRAGLGLLRRYYEYGLGDPALFRDHRVIGATRAPWRATMRTYAGLVLRIPMLWSARHRERWLRQFGRRVGRLVGSVRCWTWLP